MAHYQSYRCPDCQGLFRHMHHPDDSPPPDRCPLCGAWVSEDAPPEPAFIPQAPGIRKSAYARSVDQTYRAMEQSSIERADDAAALLEAEYARQPKDEMADYGLLKVMHKEQAAELKSSLKITDMKDPSQMRAGDNAVIGGSSAPNMVNGAGFRSLAGPVPGSGTNAPFISQATADHSARAAQMIQAGRINR